jgi:hypothetical protein
MKLSPNAKRMLKLAVTVLLLGALLLSLDVTRLAAAVFQVDPAWMLAGVALCFLFVAARMFKWIVLARANGLDAPPLEMVRAMLFALALGIVTPARVGEVVAISPFAPEERPRAILAYVFDRVGELATVLLFCAPAAFVFLPGWGALLGLGLGAGSIAIVLAVQVPWLRRQVAARLPRKTPARLREVLGSAIAVPPSYWLISLVTYLVTYASVAAFISGSQPVEGWLGLLLLPPVTLSNLVTITVGGLGLREGLAALLGPVGGIMPEVAAAAFFLSFFWTRLLPGLVGVGWNLAHGTGSWPENGRE